MSWRYTVRVQCNTFYIVHVHFPRICLRVRSQFTLHRRPLPSIAHRTSVQMPPNYSKFLWNFSTSFSFIAHTAETLTLDELNWKSFFLRFRIPAAAATAANAATAAAAATADGQRVASTEIFSTMCQVYLVCAEPRTCGARATIYKS